MTGVTHAFTPPCARQAFSRSGFSLVELSIVLVILGLLTGGILTGQNLIRAAELRSLTTEFQQYQTAVRTFQDKYFYLPGDMPNATDFWGAATCPASAGTGTQTCNGNGDGSIDSPAAGGEYGEMFTFWQHLANAGLIEGSFTGMAGSASDVDHIAGENAPKSRLGNAVWHVEYISEQASGFPRFFDGSYGNMLWAGVITSSGIPNGSILTPEEAWSIDKKIDDGIPARGRTVVRRRVACTIAADGSSLTTAPADAAQLDAKYNLSVDETECVLTFKTGF